MKSNQAVKIVKTLRTPTEVGEYYRLVCMTGKNKGFVYYLNEERVVLGRSEQCDIQVWDNKSSREHAELTKVDGNYIVTDLGSQNGIIINDDKVKQQILIEGDLLIIGQTVYKFNYIEVKKNSLMLVKEEEEEDIEEFDIFADDKKNVAQKKPANKRVLIYGSVLVLLFFLLSEEDSGKKKRAPRRKTVNTTNDFDEVIRNKQANTDKVLEKKVMAYVHRGQREYREDNFFRAIEQFNLALILDPNHSNASFYLARSKQRLDEKIKNMEIKAERELSSLRYKSAFLSYCSILGFLKKYPEDKRFVNAKKQVDGLLVRLEKDDEYKCF